MEIATALHSPACIINGWTFLLSLCVCVSVCVVQMTELASWDEEIRTALLISLPPAAMNGKSSALYFCVCVYPRVRTNRICVCVCAHAQRTFSPIMALELESFLFIMSHSYMQCVHRYSRSYTALTLQHDHTPVGSTVRSAAHLWNCHVIAYWFCLFNN